MGARVVSVVLYVDSDLRRGQILASEVLDKLTERHLIDLKVEQTKPLVAGSVAAAASEHRAEQVILELSEGLPTLRQLWHAMLMALKGYALWFYWPMERAIERVRGDRLKRIAFEWLVSRIYRRHTQTLQSAWLRLAGRMARGCARGSVWLTTRFLPREPDPSPVAADVKRLTAEQEDSDRREEPRRHVARLRTLIDPTPLNGFGRCSERAFQRGLYLRLDFWAQITYGGSYGHTIYVAKELARRSGELLAVTANDFREMPGLGVRQEIFKPPTLDGNETNIVGAASQYYCILSPMVATCRPDFIYERSVIGNYVGALLSAEYDIPYIVEYNGSEATMLKSLTGKGYEFEDYYNEIETLQFAQATAINAVSEIVRDNLVKRGVPAEKILVNPNGVDAEAFVAPAPAERQRIRGELGIPGDAPLAGFTGTFGFWHGIDVLAETIAETCRRDASFHFLLIGDGNFRGLLNDLVRDHRLEHRVHFTGSVPQDRGRELVRACDYFLSPHKQNMAGTRFFGSPTKIFEYMSVGGTIIASDLEQIGEVLSPALRVEGLNGGATVGQERAILCQPGDAGAFVRALLWLKDHPGQARALARNARQAVEMRYTWSHHVDRLLDFLVQRSDAIADSGRRFIDAEEREKRDAQDQWNENPCGSHYAKGAPEQSLEWFQEVEAYRYDTYAPWMPELMEFDAHADERVLEIGAGLGTDLSRFARGGAQVTDLDLSSGHLKLVKRNFKLRGLTGDFRHGDGETLPFEADHFDLVYANGVIHHTPHTATMVDEIHRVLKPGGKAIIMVYAYWSLHYWYRLFYEKGLLPGDLNGRSMGDIMSRTVEITENDARPLVKVYTARELRRLFRRFHGIQIHKRQMLRVETEPLPLLHRLPLSPLQRFAGWNLIIKAWKG